MLNDQYVVIEEQFKVSKSNVYERAVHMTWAGPARQLAHLGEIIFIPRSYGIFYLLSVKKFMSLEKRLSW